MTEKFAVWNVKPNNQTVNTMKGNPKKILAKLNILLSGLNLKG